MISIILVDDHKLIREGLKSFLESSDEIEVIGEAENGKKGLEFISRHQVDVVVSDIAMPEMNGLDFVKELKIGNPDQKVLTLTMMNENHHIKQMLSAGSNGYVLKNCTEEEFKKAIKTVAGGGSYYSPEVTEVIMDNLNRSKKPKQRLTYEIPLTSREKEVLHLICKEMGNQEIADVLFISGRTVEAHKRNLLEKTGCKNVAGLVVYAIERSLFDDL